MSDLQGQVEDIAPEEGQAIDMTPEAPEEGQAFSYEYEGKSFGNPNELTDFIRQGSLRHSDYSRKTQALAEDRKAWEADRQKFQKEREEFDSRRREYDKIDKYLRTLRPDQYQRLVQSMKQPDPSAMFDQSRKYVDDRTGQLEEQLKEFKEWREQQERDTRKETALKALEERYQDFDRKSVTEQIQEMYELPPGEVERKLAELVYLATKGKENPAALERKFAEKVSQTVPKGGGAKTVSGQKSYASLDEAAQIAKQELGV